MKKIHLIQVIGLKKLGKKPQLNMLGIISVSDNNYVTYNPCFKHMKKLHWTYHKDGTSHAKDNNGNIVLKNSGIPLVKLKGNLQFLSSSNTIENLEGQLKYSLRGNNYGLFLIDLTNFKKAVIISIHLSDSRNVGRCCKIFSNKKDHQCFIYWKSKPKIIVHAFDE